MSQSTTTLLSVIVKVALFLGCVCLEVQCESRDLKSISASRDARVMQFLSDPKLNLNYHRRPVLLPRIRADNIPYPRLSVQHGPLAALRPPPPPVGAQIRRRDYSGNSPDQQLLNYQYDPAKVSRFTHVKNGVVLDGGKSHFYHSKVGQPSNAVQYHSEQYIQNHNFKGLPRFDGITVLKDQINQYGLQKPPLYTPIQQHAIPLQVNQYASISQDQGNSDGYSLVPSKETLIQQTNSGQGQTSYSIYEEAEQNAAKEAIPAYNPALGYHQHAAVGQPLLLSKEAQNYLNFISSNEYFLPKLDPNYKQLDADHDQVRYQQQLQHQQEQLQRQAQHHAQQQQKFQNKQTQLVQSPSHLTDNSFASSYSQPIKVSELFFQQDPAPSNSAIVRGSHQGGQDSFVVKSNGNKAVKHIVSTPLSPETTTQSSLSFSQVTHNTYRSHNKVHTPEPLRFEFTEQDARASSSFTHSTQGQQLYYETITSTTGSPAVGNKPKSDISKAVSKIADDSEDSADVGDDNMASSLQTTPVTSLATPTDLKETEAYCEKTCANVYDENDEIVCGSDGYMYTGESQLECYSSCLKISVSIKSKGSCGEI